MAHFEKTFVKIVDFNLTGDIKKSHWTNSETKFRARPENYSFRGLKRNLYCQNAQKRHFWAYLGLNLVLSQKPLTRIFLKFPPRKLTASPINPARGPETMVLISNFGKNMAAKNNQIFQ